MPQRCWNWLVCTAPQPGSHRWLASPTHNMLHTQHSHTFTCNGPRTALPAKGCRPGIPLHGRQAPRWLHRVLTAPASSQQSTERPRGTTSSSSSTRIVPSSPASAPLWPRLRLPFSRSVHAALGPRARLCSVLCTAVTYCGIAHQVQIYIYGRRGSELEGVRQS